MFIILNLVKISLHTTLESVGGHTLIKLARLFMSIFDQLSTLSLQ